ncbi:imidazoleglycerol-phosphate dehydratase HisB [Candidatus Aerophobetes bacterium]|nr:imidazoleglycerol-phosphate dehydratase HisB [Candidatus Aerophobetes bacterium]
MLREAEVKRKTQETEVSLYLNLDGSGKSSIDTGYPFFDHMLRLFCWHGFFDLKIKAQGDIQVDEHHLVEDVGICLGKALSNAIRDKRGIKRYGWSLVPMDDVLVLCAVDISGRASINFDIKNKVKDRIIDSFRDFFKAFCNFAGITLHVDVLYGGGYHHVLEGIFKSFGITLDQATQMEERRKDIPSSKGYIEEV